MTILHESQLFATTTLFPVYLAADEILIERREHYQKRSPRNRYNILTSQGVKTLSIPLSKGKNQQMPIIDVKISYDENWIKNHLETIRSSYGKSPFFDFYFQDIERTFKNRYTYLYDLNMDILVLMLKALKIKAKLSETMLYSTDYSKHAKLIDFRERTENFNKKISPQLLAYPQVWESHTGFTPCLSIIDLLLCMGPEAESYLRKIQPMIVQNL